MWENNFRASYLSEFSIDLNGARIAQLAVCWARCPGWCSVAGLTFLWASSRGDFSLELAWALSDESINRGLVCAHVFHRMDSKDHNTQVLDGQMPHPACTTQEDGMWLWPWIKVTGELRKLQCKLSHKAHNQLNGIGVLLRLVGLMNLILFLSHPVRIFMGENPA